MSLSASTSALEAVASSSGNSRKKIIATSFDLGNVAAFDINPFDEKRMLQSSREEREAYLLELASDNTRVLFEALRALPTKTDPDVGSLTVLPKPLVVLPREKPVPVEKPATRWEKFARVKGITKQKRSAKVFDEASGEWKARFGARSAKNAPLADWCEEVKDE
jgi:regulator of ribosome biosynthesis